MSSSPFDLISFVPPGPITSNPRRVTAAEIRSAFSEGWRVEGISDACYETNFDNICAMAWLATIVRGDGGG